MGKKLSNFHWEFQFCTDDSIIIDGSVSIWRYLATQFCYKGRTIRSAINHQRPVHLPADFIGQSYC